MTGADDRRQPPLNIQRVQPGAAAGAYRSTSILLGGRTRRRRAPSWVRLRLAVVPIVAEQQSTGAAGAGCAAGFPGVAAVAAIADE